MAEKDEKRLRRLVGRTQVFLLDMDGTVYIGDTPIGAMAETLASVRSSGRRIVYCTNNSSRTAEEYIRKLERLGLYDPRDAVYTSGMATAEYLKERYPGKRINLVGTDALKRSFEEQGLLLGGKDADVAVLAYDTTLTFEKLVTINELIAEGKPYLATHADRVCPAQGVYPPDVGSFIELLKCSSGRAPDIICGKPERVMGDMLLKKLGVSSSSVTMVGDRPYTDIRFGNNNLFGTLLVLSGETNADQAAHLPVSDRPSAIAESLNAVVKYL